MFFGKGVMNVPLNEGTCLSEISSAITSGSLRVLDEQCLSGVSKSHSSPTSFALFPALPSEIRQHIFRLALPHRVVSLTYDLNNNRFTSSTQSPALLRVSYEARLATLQLYRLAFGTASHPPETYFNPYLDTLYLPRHAEMGYDENFRRFREIVADPCGLLNMVQKVAVDHVDPDIKRPWEGYNKASFLRGFKNAEEIVLVHSNISFEDQASMGKKELVQFTTPKLQPEQQLQIWWHFRQSFVFEEKLLAEVCSEIGQDYDVFKLPTVRICGTEIYWPSGLSE